MKLSHQVARLERIARSRIVGGLLLLGAGAFVVPRWWTADWSALTGIRLSMLTLVGAAYAGAVLSLVIAATGRVDVVSWPAILRSQLLKYIPGGVWQGQPFVDHGGFALAVSYAWATLVAASIAVSGGTMGWTSVGGALVAGVLVVLFARWRGARAAAWGLVFSAVAALLIATSGGLAAAALGGDTLVAGRAVAAAWGVGVAALPVPGGLGVREAAITVLLGPESAPLATTHRLVTLAADTVLGLSGIWIGQRTRRQKPMI